MAPERTLYALAAFLIGVFLAGLHRPLLLAATVAVLAGWRLLRLLPLALILISFAAGFLYYHAYFTLQAHRAAWPEAGELFAAVVVNEPFPGPRSEHLLVRLRPPHHGMLTAITSPDVQYAYGDLLQLRGRIEQGVNEREQPVMAFPKIQRIAEHEASAARADLIAVKHALLRPFQRSLPEAEAAFLGGITLGARAALPEALKTEMKKSGTTHLVALSGYNVQLVIIAMFGLAAFFLGRRSAYAATGFAIAAFVLMVGFEASIMRAAIMALLFLTAKELGRLASMPHAMLWTATVMTAADPAALFSAGFQLSFASLLGVLYIAPRIARYIPWSETASLTLGAQAAVAPVLLARFGEFSLVALPANLLILPLIPVTMALGFILALAGALTPVLGYAPALPLHLLLRYELGMVHFWGQF